MRRTHSERVERFAPHRLDRLIASWALSALWLAAPLAAQDGTAQDDTATITAAQDTIATTATTDSLVGAAVSVGGDAASLDLQLSSGRTVQLELSEGVVYADGESLGTYDQGGSLERSWRALLEEAAMASTTQLPLLLRDWEAPAVAGALGQRLDQRLEQALAGVGGRMVVAQRSAMPLEDSIEALLQRIDQLEEHEEDLRRHEYVERSAAEAFVHDFTEGLALLFATLVWFAVMFGIGAALLFFGEGRLERVSDTVRDEPLRSWLIGIAGAFLAIPFYVLVMLALAISILGIPLIIAWAPLFPLLVGLAAVAGWIAVAYSFGQRMVERKLRGNRRFENPGRMHYMAVGVVLLLSPFILGALFHMTSLLEGIGALIFGLGIFANVLFAAMGFGAVLVRGSGAWERRRDRRVAEKRARLEQPATTQESTNV